MKLHTYQKELITQPLPQVQVQQVQVQPKVHELEKTISEQQRKIEELQMKLQTYQQGLTTVPQVQVQQVQVQQVPNDQLLQSQITAMQNQIQQAQQLNAIQHGSRLSITPVTTPVTPIITQVETTPTTVKTFEANTSIVNLDDIFGTGKITFLKTFK